MTPDIILVLTILTAAVILFVTEWLRIDLVALFVLTGLALTGLLTPGEAFSGFSSPAVVTIWAMFILSGGLSRTGVATTVGRVILRVSPRGTIGLLLVLMLAAGVMSAFMNNVGVAALLLPVVMDIARRTRQAPSKLLMPLSYAAMLGGTLTLIATPTNILISDALAESGLRPFEMFDYTPIGLIVMLVGIAFVALTSGALLPTRTRDGETSGSESELGQVYHFEERLFYLRLPPDTPLAGKRLAESRLGAALGLNVTGLIRKGSVLLAPGADTRLEAGDRLQVAGRLDRLDELRGQQQLVVEDDDVVVQRLVTDDSGVSEVRLTPESALGGKTLLETNFRRRYGLNVLAVMREGSAQHSGLQDMTLEAGDRLLLQGPQANMAAFVGSPDFAFYSVPGGAGMSELARLNKRFVALRVPTGSLVAGRTLVESRLGEAYDLTVVGVERAAEAWLMPDPEMTLQAEDTLLVLGEAGDLDLLRSLKDLEIEVEMPNGLEALSSEQVGFTEVVFSPHTRLAGQTLREINFREKYGLSVLAVWRGERAYRSNLRDMALRPGDALFVHGPREKLKLLGRESDFLVLTQEAQEPPIPGKAPIAVLIMAGVLLPVILGWVSIAVAGVTGAALMVLTGCLTMEEAYRFIEWRAVFLIAGMLPLGIAMEQSGAAQMMAEGLVATVGGMGPIAVAGAFYVLAALASQVMPNPAVALLLAPIALRTATGLDLSPYPLMMTVALSASASFLSPVAHPANVLIMGPGGYKFSDYIRAGLPLTLVVGAVTLLTLPIFWPF